MLKLTLTPHQRKRVRELAELTALDLRATLSVVNAGHVYHYTRTDRRNLVLLHGKIEPITEIREYTIRSYRVRREAK